MSRPNSKNQVNAKPSKGQEITQPSQTIPDQSLSIVDIMRRSASGLPLVGQKIPIYNGEDVDHPDLTKMDLAEREAYIKSQEMELRDLQLKIKSEKDSEDAKKADAVKTSKKGQQIEEAEIIEETPTTPPKKNQKPGSSV